MRAPRAQSAVPAGKDASTVIKLELVDSELESRNRSLLLRKYLAVQNASPSQKLIASLLDTLR